MKGSTIWVKFEFQNSENMKSIVKRVTGTHHEPVCLFNKHVIFNKLNTATNLEFNEGSILISQGIQKVAL
jgi:hypothetical protein